MSNPDRSRAVRSDEADLLEMRAAAFRVDTKRATEIEGRMRPTNTADPRHAAWYAAHRAEVEADPSVRAFRSLMRAQGRAVETRSSLPSVAARKPSDLLTDAEMEEVRAWALDFLAANPDYFVGMEGE